MRRTNGAALLVLMNVLAAFTFLLTQLLLSDFNDVSGEDTAF